MQRRDEDLLHAERLDAGAGADDIRDGIERAHFVELHVVRGLTVDFPLGLGDTAEDRERVLFDKRGQFTVFDQLANLVMIAAVAVLVFVMMAFDFGAVVMVVCMFVLMVMVFVAMLVLMLMVLVLVFVVLRMLVFVLVPMFMFAVLMLVVMLVLFILVVMMLLVPVLVGVRMFMGMFVSMLMFMSVLVLVVAFALFILVVRVRRALVDAELHALHLLPLLAVEVHVEIAEIELRELPFEGRGFHAEIDEGADGHVAGDAGKAIEEEDFHKGAAER